MTSRPGKSHHGSADNTPQHLVGEEPEITEGRPMPSHQRTGIPTGEGTAPANVDVADPHPSNEEHPYRERHPGGASPPARDIGPNPAKHDGSAPPRPHNAGSGPE